MRKFLITVIYGLIAPSGLFAQNPIVRDQFTADPTARVFGDSVYLYPSHDIPAPANTSLRKDWFCMEDYHVFSSQNLTEWTDHGVIVSQTTVPWANPKAYSMWAPDCIHKNGKYYFYFPAPAKDTTYGRGFSIGVAISGSPVGPFTPQSTPIINVHGIDPNVFIDKDGQAYLYWSARHIYVARLNDNMTELASEPQIISNLPDKGLKEGSFLFERNGIYYLTFPHVENRIERLEYATGSHPMGPFKMMGVIMDESPTGCWTNHHSFINFKEQWYLFYHHNDYSPKFDKMRSTRIDSVFFNNDGTIRKVVPSLRGIGLSDPSKTVQIDRYSKKSESGASIAFVDSLNTFGGWKTVFAAKGSWIQYDAVDFGSGKDRKYKSVKVKAASESGGTVEIRLNSVDGKRISEVKIPKGEGMNEVKATLTTSVRGVNNLVVVLNDSNPVEVDWISFE